MRTTWTFRTAGQLTFGCGAANQVGSLAAEWNIGRMLIVTDPPLTRAGLLDRVRQPLLDAGVVVDVFDGGEAEPSIDAALQAVAHARRFRPEGILGLGGGSNMDLAKVTAAVTTHGGVPADYFGFDKVPGPVLPLLCAPTTAGTGSEVSHAAVLTNTEQQMKVSTLSHYLRPKAAIVDPELTLSCPPEITAGSGLDALTHAIEAYTATDFRQLEVPDDGPTPYEGRFLLGEMFAEKAIELIGRHLATAVRQGDNREAREALALAATLAGIAFSNCGVALVHALEYPLGGALHVAHGAGNGLLLPYVMQFNLPEREAAFARVAELLGENVAGADPRRAAQQAVEAVRRLQRETGVPGRIRDIGGSAEQLPDFAAKAFEIKRLLAVNPRRATQQDLLQILQSAL